LKLDQAKETGSFYTPQSVVFDALCRLRFSGKKIYRILEPSVGMGAFLPQLFSLIEPDQFFEIDVVDIKKETLIHLEETLKLLDYNRDKIKINFIESDFVLAKLNGKYDLIVGNPPFFKVTGSLLINYRTLYKESVLSNIFGYFMKKAYELSPEIIFVMPKTFIMTPEFNSVKSLYEETNIVSIYDYGVHYFDKVFVEILAIHFKKDHISPIYIESKLDNTIRLVQQKYLFHRKHWLLYRDDFFDNYIASLKLDVFDFFRDRQLTNSIVKTDGKIWVIKSKNMLDDGTIVHKGDYDRYVDDVSSLVVGKYLNTSSIIMTSFTYNTRAAILPPNSVVNGSIAVLIPKFDQYKKIDLSLYSTTEFRKYYAIVKNNSKFTINIDSNSIYYIGVKKDE